MPQRDLRSHAFGGGEQVLVGLRGLHEQRPDRRHRNRQHAVLPAHLAGVAPLQLAGQQRIVSGRDRGRDGPQQLSCRGFGTQRRPGPGWTLEHEPAAERLHPVGETAQAGAPARNRSADPVVAHLDAGVAVAAPELDADLRRLRVLGHVGERLGDHVIGGRLDGIGKPLVDADVELDRQRRAVGQRPHRRLQPALGQHGGMDAARQLAQLLQGVRELVAGELEVAVLGMPARRQPQHQRQRDEPLLRAVVQVALQPPPLGVAGLDDARARGGEIGARLRIGQRLRRELGEVRDPLLGARRERSSVTLETITAPHIRR